MNVLREDEFLKAFDEYSDALFRHASFRLSDRERAIDLTQETFVKAWEYLGRGEQIRQWKSFLYHVLHNLIIDEYRRKKDQSLDALFDEEPTRASAYISTGSRTEHEEALDETLLIEHIRTLLPHLKENQRTVLTFRFVDGLGLKEIATSLGITENAVSVRINRGVKQLQRLCAEHGLI